MTAHAQMLLMHALVFITVIAALVSHFPTIGDPASQITAVFAIGMAAAVRRSRRGPPAARSSTCTGWTPR
jgi:hypothetical protein